MHTRLVTVCVVTTVRCDGALQRDRVSGKRCCRIKGVTVGRYPRSWDGHSLCLVIGLYGLGRVLHLGIHTGRGDGSVQVGRMVRGGHGERGGGTRHG